MKSLSFFIFSHCFSSVAPAGLTVNPFNLFGGGGADGSGTCHRLFSLLCLNKDVPCKHPA